MMQRIASFAVFIFCFVYLNAQPRFPYLDQYFSALKKNDQFNGAIIVADHGKVVFKYASGLADFTTKARIDLNTAFPIASISKTFTATAILQLAEAGKLNVADPVAVYLTRFPYPTITIRHLLSHTSGLPPYNAFFDTLRKLHPDTTFTNADFINGIIANPKPLIYTPGEKGNYDNINFLVLAMIIEKVSGSTYEDFIEEHILRPAGMTHTAFVPLRSQYTRPAKVPFAYPHLFPHMYSETPVKASDIPYIVQYWSAYNFSGFAEYTSTLGDLLNYDKAYYDGTLLKPATLEQAFKPVLLNSGRQSPGNFGLGWELATSNQHDRIVYHNGNATGLSCTLLRDITTRQTIILFDNIHTNNSQSIAFKVLNIVNQVHEPLPKKSIAAAYVKSLLKNGPEVARKMVYSLVADTSNYVLNEDEINSIGYDLMGGINNPNPYHFPEERKYNEAFETFKLNVELFPNSWNVYDSYGEILLLLGRKDEAISMYRKSVELNPNNTGGKKILAELQQ